MRLTGKKRPGSRGNDVREFLHPKGVMGHRMRAEKMTKYVEA